MTAGNATTDDPRGSGPKIITKFVGNELRKDLNGDGRDDVAFFLTQERGHVDEELRLAARELLAAALERLREMRERLGVPALIATHDAQPGQGDDFTFDVAGRGGLLEAGPITGGRLFGRAHADVQHGEVAEHAGAQGGVAGLFGDAFRCLVPGARAVQVFLAFQLLADPD